jgi:hypothetical protein
MTGCHDCSIRKHHETMKEPVTKRGKRWDEVLTETCNTCKDGSNFYNGELNDLFIEKLALKLKLGGMG